MPDWDYTGYNDYADDLAVGGKVAFRPDDPGGLPPLEGDGCAAAHSLCLCRRVGDGMRSGRYSKIVVGVAACLCLTTTQAKAQVNQAQPSAKTAQELAEKLGVRSLSKGTSSWTEKRRAIKELPVNGLNPQQRARADRVLRSISQFRKLPTIQTPIEPAVFQYFLNQPDVAVSLWRVMGISEFKLWQTGVTSFQADAGDGSVGSADFLYRDNQQCLIACDGMYQNPMLKKPIEARALVHMKYQFQPGKPGKPPTVTQQVSTFVSFPSTAVKTVAKVISPVTNKIMDRNCLEITVFLKVMSDSMEARPQWVQSMAAKMDGVQPQRRTELAELAANVNTQAQARSSQSNFGRASLSGNDPSRSMLPITPPSGGIIRRATRQRTLPPRR